MGDGKLKGKWDINNSYDISHLLEGKEEDKKPSGSIKVEAGSTLDASGVTSMDVVVTITADKEVVPGEPIMMNLQLVEVAENGKLIPNEGAEIKVEFDADPNIRWTAIPDKPDKMTDQGLQIVRNFKSVKPEIMPEGKITELNKPEYDRPLKVEEATIQLTQDTKLSEGVMGGNSTWNLGAHTLSHAEKGKLTGKWNINSEYDIAHLKEGATAPALPHGTVKILPGSTLDVREVDTLDVEVKLTSDDFVTPFGKLVPLEFSVVEVEGDGKLTFKPETKVKVSITGTDNKFIKWQAIDPIVLTATGLAVRGTQLKPEPIILPKEQTTILNENDHKAHLKVDGATVKLDKDSTLPDGASGADSVWDLGKYTLSHSGKSNLTEKCTIISSYDVGHRNPDKPGQAKLQSGTLKVMPGSTLDASEVKEMLVELTFTSDDFITADKPVSIEVPIITTEGDGQVISNAKTKVKVAMQSSNKFIKWRILEDEDPQLTPKGLEIKPSAFKVQKEEPTTPNTGGSGTGTDAGTGTTPNTGGTGGTAGTGTGGTGGGGRPPLPPGFGDGNVVLIDLDKPKPTPEKPTPADNTLTLIVNATPLDVANEVLKPILSRAVGEEFHNQIVPVDWQTGNSDAARYKKGLQELSTPQIEESAKKLATRTSQYRTFCTLLIWKISI